MCNYCSKITALVECLPRTRALLPDLQVFHIICFQRRAGPILNLKLKPPFTPPTTHLSYPNPATLVWMSECCEKHFKVLHDVLLVDVYDWSAHWCFGGGVILCFASRESCQVFNLRSSEKQPQTFETILNSIISPPKGSIWHCNWSKKSLHPFDWNYNSFPLFTFAMVEEITVPCDGEVP